MPNQRGDGLRELAAVAALLAVVTLTLWALLVFMGCELSWELPCRR